MANVHLYAAQGYLDVHGTPLGIADLNEHMFVDYVEDMIEIQALRWLSDVAQASKVVFRSTSPLVQLSAVRNGLGIGMFPDYLVRDEDDLVRILGAEVRTRREFWVAIHQELLRVPRMRAAYEFVTSCLIDELGDQ